MQKRTLKSKNFITVYYLLFFTLVFVIFLYLTFPVESFKQRIIYEMENRTPFDVDIKSVSISPILRLNIHGATLYRTKKPFLDIDDLEINTSPLQFLSSSLELPFKANLLGGETKGSLTYNLKTSKILEAEAKINGINMEKIMSAIPSDSGKQRPLLQGIINGGFSVKLNSPLTQGEFDFNINKLGISNVKLTNFVIPAFSNLKSTFKGKIENEITRVDQLQLDGDDIHLLLSGTMPLLWRIHRGGKIDFRFRLQSTGDKLGLVRAFLTPKGNGTLGGKIVGTLTSPRLVPHEEDRL